jgi:hypothetical protein
MTATFTRLPQSWLSARSNQGKSKRNEGLKVLLSFWENVEMGTVRSVPNCTIWRDDDAINVATNLGSNIGTNDAANMLIKWLNNATNIGTSTPN